MSFLDDIKRFNAKVETKVEAVFDGVVEESFKSIVEGSPITGAPGQPVSPAPVPEAGNLRDSWKNERVSATDALISTDVSYAPDVEDNVHGFTFANHGPHSVKLTIAGFPRVVAIVAQKVADQ